MCDTLLHGEEQLTAAGLAEVQETAVGRRGQSYSLFSVPLHPPATLTHKFTVVAGPNMEEFDGTPEIAKWCTENVLLDCNNFCLGTIMQK